MEKIITFNSQQGVYQFELSSIASQLHAHPAVEIIYTNNTTFSLTTPHARYEQISFAIIAANTPHQLNANTGDFKLLMIEIAPNLLTDYLARFSIKLSDNTYTASQQQQGETIFSFFSQLYTEQKIPKTNSPRIAQCLEYLDSPEADYNSMIKVLKGLVNLSESRLSHLFKAEMGISIKKYLVWGRLKKAIQLVVNDNVSLYEAAITSGFFDQAHLSKAFKQMLGINPSEAYNSRTLQE